MKNKTQNQGRKEIIKIRAEINEIDNKKLQRGPVKPKVGSLRGSWVAQLVKLLTLDFGSGHDLRVMKSSPR